MAIDGAPCLLGAKLISRGGTVDRVLRGFWWMAEGLRKALGTGEQADDDEEVLFQSDDALGRGHAFFEKVGLRFVGLGAELQPHQSTLELQPLRA